MSQSDALSRTKRTLDRTIHCPSCLYICFKTRFSWPVMYQAELHWKWVLENSAFHRQSCKWALCLAYQQELRSVSTPCHPVVYWGWSSLSLPSAYKHRVDGHQLLALDYALWRCNTVQTQWKSSILTVFMAFASLSCLCSWLEGGLQYLVSWSLYWDSPSVLHSN